MAFQMCLQLNGQLSPYHQVIVQHTGPDVADEMVRPRIVLLAEPTLIQPRSRGLILHFSRLFHIHIGLVSK